MKMLNKRARKIAARIALKMAIRKDQPQYGVAQRLLADGDLFDAWYHGFAAEREPENTGGFLEFLQELFKSILSDPDGFITFITALLELYKSFGLPAHD